MNESNNNYDTSEISQWDKVALDEILSYVSIFVETDHISQSTEGKYLINMVSIPMQKEIK